ncbi:hypothetical protein Z945_3309 [Sulfitobacter noctilucae]|uniref:hypothetical protein n=1 Tax=Sulfitobacter noctilucae TaxID=1342302 RepID=UPI00046A5D80|nr:hypothetical protein [Sulfitobacter noctilucae]KIN70845.1 hypothetical protein Z945_3309 [Sulfitobacter noctilucae]
MSQSSNSTDPAALAVYQRHLDTLTRALLAGRFEDFAQNLRFPHEVVTMSNRFIAKTAEDAKQMFHDFRTCLTAEGITDLVRIAQDARFVGDDEITGSHISHRMRGANRVIEPYQNQLRLVRGTDKIWREASCLNMVANKAGAFGILVHVDRQPPVSDLKIQSERNPI